MPNFESINLKSHIRTLAFQDPFLLAGSGSFVFVWRRNEFGKFKFIRSVPLMQQDIIGIKFVKNNNGASTSKYLQVVFYSIRFIQYCSILFNSNNFEDFKITTHCKTNIVHRILDLVCLYDGKSLLINSHNEIIVQNLNSNLIQQRILGIQKCILYSARFLEVDTNFLIVASGTVFKDVLIWSLEYVSSSKSNSSVSEIQTLHGHDGVIFDIDYNARFNILITVSDDRSIRIWSGSKDFINERTLATWHSNQFTLVHIYYGHEARIWKVRSLMFHNFPICISVGEDSCLIVWSLSEPYQMIKKRKFFRNTRIWSLEVITPDFIICGGSDGSIRFSLFEDILHLNQFKLKMKKYEISQFKTISYMKTKPTYSILASCINGQFYLIRDDIEQLDFNTSELSTIFNDYIKLASNKDRSKLVIGSKYGHIGLLNVIQDDTFKLVSLEQKFDQKIFDLSFVSDNKLIVCLIDGIVKIFEITDSSLITKSDQNYILPLSKHRWSCCGLIYKNLFVLGDYSGNVFAYYTDCSDPFLKLRNIHGRNGVTCIKKKPNSCLVYSSGRNGKIMEYFIEECSQTGCVTNFLKLRIYYSFSNMEWIGGFEFNEQSLRFVYGFESRKFLVWDMSHEIVELEEDCGGGHRSWDVIFRTYSDVDDQFVEVNFSYSQKNNLVQISRLFPSPPLSSFCYSSIPRKINCCATFDDRASFSYFMIGGEERSIQLIRYNIEKDSFELNRVLYGHISNVTSIKCLDLFKVDQTIYVISVGGRSQLIIWKFWFVTTQSNNYELICQEKIVNFLGIFNEQMEFEDNIRKSNQNDMMELDVRYLDVDFKIVSSLNSNVELLIIVACSNAEFRIFNFSERPLSKIKYVKKIGLGNSCILRVKIVPQNDSMQLDGDVCALSTNNGLIHIWSLNRINTNTGNINCHQLFSSRLHQTGINSFDLILTKDVLMVATGGDDNTITISLFNISYDSQNGQWHFKWIHSFNDNSVHTCQITDLKFYNHQNLISVSIDQQMICWDISHLLLDYHQKFENIITYQTIPVIDRYILSIADISSICLIVDRKLSDDRNSLLWVICGEGFQLVRNTILNLHQREKLF